MTVSDFIRRLFWSVLRTSLFVAYDKAMEDYKSNPVTYSHDETRKMLELD